MILNSDEKKVYLTEDEIYFLTHWEEEIIRKFK